MPFSDYEVTPSLGFPVEAFDFFVHGVHYRYVNHDEDVVTPQDGTWTSARLSRGRFIRGMEIDQSNITVTADRELEIVKLFNEGTPESVVELTIYRLHASDPNREKWKLWFGQVTTLKRTHKEIQFNCEVPEISLRTLGLRRRYQRSCPYPIYGTGCNVSKALHRLNTSVVSVSQAGSVVQVAVADCTPYSGGLMTAFVDGVQRERHIVEGSGNSLKLIRPITWGAPGVPVSIYPGCGKTLEICWNKFNNGLNFGGLRYMPETNPFSSQVY